MTKFVTLSMLATMLALSAPAGVALADDHDGHEGMRHRERCTWVRKCHHEDGHRICEKVKVCHEH